MLVFSIFYLAKINYQCTSMSADRPEVVLSNPKSIGQLLGKETILDCQIYAHPQAMTNWEKNGKPLVKSDKYVFLK